MDDKPPGRYLQEAQKRLVQNSPPQTRLKLYKLDINGAYSGHYNSPADAMAEVEKRARPFGYKWVIFDPFGKVYAQG